MSGPGTLPWAAVTDGLVAEPVAAVLNGWASVAQTSAAQIVAAEIGAAQIVAAQIDPELADTAAFCERYQVSLEDSANCVIIAGKRGENVSYAACVVLATTRADVNNVVRRRLDARRASFAPMDDAVARTGMEYGGITPIGLPPDWPILIDAAVLTRDMVVIGSGLRRSKIALPPRLLAELPGAEVVEGLAS